MFFSQYIVSKKEERTLREEFEIFRFILPNQTCAWQIWSCLEEEECVVCVTLEAEQVIQCN